MTSQQKTALSGLEDRLVEIDSLRTGLTNLEIAQTKALSEQQGLVVDVEAITKDIVGATEKSNLQLVELKKELAALDSGLEKYKVTSLISYMPHCQQQKLLLQLL